MKYIGIAEILAIIFIVLKLTGTITWSWWWVLSPFWLPIVIAFGVAGIALCIAALLDD